MQNLFISAGDASGDRHASDLIKAIKEINPGIYVTSAGGQNLKAVSDDFLADLTALSAFGFTEPLKQYLKLKDIFNNKIKASFKAGRPDKIILVDYYGFNIHIAEEGYRRNIPVYYYISPQVWASRPGRIKRLAKYIKKMLVILPFEEELYNKSGVNAQFVGHPLIDTVPKPDNDRKTLPAKPLIGLFPGSRPNVIKKHIPILEKASNLIRKEMDCKAMIFGLKGRQYNTSMPVVFDDDFEERKKIDFAVSVSGTVSLENALLGIPMIVFYRLSWFNYLIAKILVKVKYITMVNILADRPVVPELIQSDATPEKISETALKILKNQSYFSKLKEDVLSFRQQLGKPGVTKRAAEIILNDL
jgi:lipid-A-disaccharide synthase